MPDIQKKIYPHIGLSETLKKRIEERRQQVQKNIIEDSLGKAPIKPKKPYQPYKPSLSSDVRDKFLINIIASLVVTVLMIIEWGYNYCSTFQEWVISFFVIYLCIFCFCVLVFSLQREWSFISGIIGFIKFRKEINRYEIANDKFHSNYKKYRIEIRSVEKKVKKYNEAKEEFVRSKEYELHYKHEMILAFNSIYTKFQLSKFKPSFHFDEITEGASERKFYEMLINYFGKNHIFVDQSYGYYYPDMVLFYPNRIPIDIEIDEPYTLKTKEPIHYIDPNTQKSIDEGRDSFFIDENWAVIRFSERQILEQPESCCKEIAKLCKFLGININHNLIHNTNDLKPEKRWMLRESIQMAEDDYRKTYLT